MLIQTAQLVGAGMDKQNLKHHHLMVTLGYVVVVAITFPVKVYRWMRRPSGMSPSLEVVANSWNTTNSVSPAYGYRVSLKAPDDQDQAA